jgi:hypothetical protein
MNIPSNLEHMFEEARDDVCVACFLLKIRDKFEMGTVFAPVG